MKKSSSTVRQITVCASLAHAAERDFLSGIFRFLDEGHQWKINLNQASPPFTADALARAESSGETDGIIISDAHAQDLISELTIDSLAKALRISRRLLELRFRELEGTTVGKFIAERRMEEATRQIRATKHTIVRIAADCGFSDAKHLTHRFKEKFGISPLQYRNGATPKTS